LSRIGPLRPGEIILSFSHLTEGRVVRRQSRFLVLAEVNYPALTDGASPPRDGDFLLLRATSIPLHPQRRFHRTEPFCNAPCGRGVTEGLLSTSFSSPSPKGTTSALTARGLYIYLFFSIKRFL
jgi:hypothetical protein